MLEIEGEMRVKLCVLWASHPLQVVLADAGRHVVEVQHTGGRLDDVLDAWPALVKRLLRVIAKSL